MKTLGITRSNEGWDSIMMCYPYLYQHRGRKYLLYNGNGFGESGFGYAVLADSISPLPIGRPLRAEAGGVDAIEARRKPLR